MNNIDLMNYWFESSDKDYEVMQILWLNVNSWGRIPEKYFYLGFFYGSKILGKKVPETLDFEQHK